MSQDERPSLPPIDDSTPRSVATRRALIAMHDFGRFASAMPAALAGQSDDWCRRIAAELTQMHARLDSIMEEARRGEHDAWKQTYGVDFINDVRAGRVPGAAGAAPRVVPAQREGEGV